MTAKWIDELEGTGMWKNEAMSAVVFPSAETLPTLRQLDDEDQKLLLIINPQWQTSGQLVSDFGCVTPASCIQCSRTFQEWTAAASRAQCPTATRANICIMPRQMTQASWLKSVKSCLVCLRRHLAANAVRLPTLGNTECRKG